MEQYKQDFINFLLKTGALNVGDFTLKNKRSSPYFVNIGSLNDGESLAALGEFFADSIISACENFDLLYGIPEKGIALAVAASIGLAKKGKNVPFFFTRKFAKEYGEATNRSQADRVKALVVGSAPKNSQSIVQLDDVFTAGDAKYEARAVLQSLGDFNLPLLAIAVDRQEVGIDGNCAIQTYEQKTGTKVASIVNALDVYTFLREKAPINTPHGEIKKEDVERMSTYLRVYGIDSARKSIIDLEGKLEQRIIDGDRSVIPACDVPFEQFESLVKETADLPGIGGYKIPARAGRKGWEKWVEVARKHTNKPLIHDGQKWGTDIPDTGQEIMKDLKESGFNAVILFPQAGPETERAWIYHALNNHLGVIVGGVMTHQAYMQTEGGFISDKGAFEIYRIAARAGINNFVVPGNKLEAIKIVRAIAEAEGVNPVFFSPGFAAQDGKLPDAKMVMGNSWHAIIGRGICEAEDMKKAAIAYINQL